LNPKARNDIDPQTVHMAFEVRVLGVPQHRAAPSERASRDAQALAFQTLSAHVGVELDEDIDVDFVWQPGALGIGAAKDNFRIRGHDAGRADSSGKNSLGRSFCVLLLPLIRLD
jgi:hypothetical protein